MIDLGDEMRALAASNREAAKAADDAGDDEAAAIWIRKAEAKEILRHAA